MFSISSTRKYTTNELTSLKLATSFGLGSRVGCRYWMHTIIVIILFVHRLLNVVVSSKLLLGRWSEQEKCAERESERQSVFYGDRKQIKQK